jgi:hypothetical protein
MNRCKKCGGMGYVPKHKNCNCSTHEAYINGCNDYIKCTKCHGFGTTGILFVKDALLTISLESKDFDSIRLAKQALKQWNLIEHE